MPAPTSSLRPFQGCRQRQEKKFAEQKQITRLYFIVQSSLYILAQEELDEVATFSDALRVPNACETDATHSRGLCTDVGESLDLSLGYEPFWELHSFLEGRMCQNKGRTTR